MKKLLFIVALFLCTLPGTAQTSLTGVLPLLQQPTRTPEQTQQVLGIFRSAKDPNTIFAAGTSLVKIPPAPQAEPVLLSLLVQESHPLKSAFSAIILTSMGSVYEQLTPLLEDVIQSQDPILRSYGAGAYALVNPEDTSHSDEVIRLFIFDADLAQRAMNMLARTDKEQLSFLKKALGNEDPQIRAAAAAWLGTLHTPAAIHLLLKRTKTEQDSTVQTQLAIALAKTPDLALDPVAKGLQTSYKKPTSATYALALGFMTGNSIDALKTALSSKKENQRINALRACAYMAGVLSNLDAFNYSTDRDFDTHLLKGLIAPISALAQNGTPAEQPYAQNALTQLEKLM